MIRNLANNSSPSINISFEINKENTQVVGTVLNYAYSSTGCFREKTFHHMEMNVDM